MCVVALSVCLDWSSDGCLFILAVLAEAEEDSGSNCSYERQSTNDSAYNRTGGSRTFGL